MYKKLLSMGTITTATQRDKMEFDRAYERHAAQSDRHQRILIVGPEASFNETALLDQIARLGAGVSSTPGTSHRGLRHSASTYF